MRVLVVVDDLDRIERNQIRDMVRLIKLVGDFPNVTYLLSYDRAPVERAVGDSLEEGAAYLEKIVQVVHDLPEPPPDAIQGILLGELQQTVDSIRTGPFYAEDWQNAWPDGLRPFFRTLRDVRRYLNAIPVTLRVVGGEVALADVLALEAVRVFIPKAYSELSASVVALTGEGRSQLLGAGMQARDEVDAARVRRILDAAGVHTEPMRELLLRLFPAIGNFVGGTRFVDGEQRARQRLRVAHADVLRTYLRRALPPGVVSGVLVTSAVENLGDGDRLEQLFESLDASIAEGLIQRLEDFEHDYEREWVESSVPVLLNQLPRLREGQRGMFDFGADLVVGRVVLRLLRTIGDGTECFTIVQRILPRVHHLTGRMELIDTVGHRKNVGHRLVTEEAATELYEELRKSIMNASTSQLPEERGLLQLFVRVLDDSERGPAWVRQACTNDSVLLQLLRSGLSEQRSQTMGDYAVRARPSLPWELLVEWLGEDQLKRRIDELGRTVDREAIPERTRVTLETAERYASGELSNERWGGEEDV
jgi:hypothetical protein